MIFFSIEKMQATCIDFFAMGLITAQTSQRINIKSIPGYFFFN